MSTYYEALPIYKAATDMNVSLDKGVRGFPRYHKYTLGSRMRETAIDIVLLISRADRREDRARLLPERCRRVDELRLLVNLRKEVAAFQSFKQFAQVMEQVVGVSRQAEGWRKSLARQVGPEPMQAAPAAARKKQAPVVVGLRGQSKQRMDRQLQQWQRQQRGQHIPRSLCSLRMG